MRMYDIIQDKRNGKKLTKEQIEFFIDGFVAETIPEYQASALMMAIYFQGMDEEETSHLTKAMAESGECIDLSCFGEKTVDKHSTGGVGDKTTLIVAPIVASIGGIVAKMSGRGLGHTGGTIDKLESIPGYQVTMKKEDFFDQISKIGISVIGQSGNLAPGDKKLYALRDVTATVDSLPLIASSIMSKKIASGAKNLVLDVKVGSGAFMKDVTSAKELAMQMVKIGRQCNRNVSAVITDMDVPLGNAIGNILEVKEAVSILRGEGPNDLREVSFALASQMLQLALGISREQSLADINDVVKKGKAFEKLKEMVVAQGGDSSYLDNLDKFDTARYSFDIVASKSGYIHQMITDKIGTASVILGAGRATKEDTIDYTAGIILSAKVGDFVKKDQVIATLYSNQKNTFPSAKAVMNNAIIIDNTPPLKRKLIYQIV